MRYAATGVLGYVATHSRAATVSRSILEWPSILQLSCREFEYIYISVQQVFQANSDRHTIVTNTFPRSIVASHIRVHPQTWYSWVSMRVEFIGCPIGEIFKNIIVHE